MAEAEMVGWHYRLNGHELEQTLGDGEGQGSLVCCSPWGHKELKTTEQLNRTEMKLIYQLPGYLDQNRTATQEEENILANEKQWLIVEFWESI